MPPPCEGTRKLLGGGAEWRGETVLGARVRGAELLLDGALPWLGVLKRLDERPTSKLLGLWEREP